MKAIITADWHLRKDKPRCRLDEDWIESQFKVVEQIVSIVNERNASLLIAGDIFHTPQQSSHIVIKTIDILKKSKQEVMIHPGNHDLSYNSIDNIDKCSFGVLTRHFPLMLEAWDGSSIIITHELVWPDSKTKPKMASGITAEELLDKYPEAKWIFVGDYHKHFHFEKDGRHVINPGCITRQASDFIDYKPGVYYVDTEKEIVEFIELNDNADMVTDEYIKQQHEREDRIASFIDTIQKQGQVTLDFLQNLKDKIKNNPDDLMDATRHVLEEIIEEAQQ